MVIDGFNFVDEKPLTVCFTNGSVSATAPGDFISSSQVKCTTPSFLDFPAKDRGIKVTLSCGSKKQTITSADFRWFKVTEPSRSIMFGPAFISGAVAGSRMSFVIQTRDEEGFNRTVGGDFFDVRVQAIEAVAAAEPALERMDSVAPETKGDESKGDADANADEEEDDEDTGRVDNVVIDDLGNGKHVVTFTPPAAGEYEITTNFQGSFGGAPGIVGKPFRVTYAPSEGAARDANTMGGPLMMSMIRSTIAEATSFLKTTTKGLGEEVQNGNRTALLRVKEHLMNVRNRKEEFDARFDVTRLTLEYLQETGDVNVDTELKNLGKSKNLWTKVEELAPSKANSLVVVEKNEGSKLTTQLSEYTTTVKRYKDDFNMEPAFWKFDVEYDDAVKEIDDFERQHKSRRIEFNSWKHMATVFDQGENVTESQKIMDAVGESINKARGLWSLIDASRKQVAESSEMLWVELNAMDLEDDVKGLQKKLRSVSKELREKAAFRGLAQMIKDFLIAVPLIGSLAHPSMRPRHWTRLMDETKTKFKPPHEDPDMQLSTIIKLELHKFMDNVEEIADQSTKEAKMEAQLSRLSESWAVVEWITEAYQAGDSVMLLKIQEDDNEMLENDQLAVQSMMGSRYLATFEVEVTKWRDDLGMISECMVLLTSVQRTWQYLEPLFIQSDEVRKELPKDAKRFEGIDKEVRVLLKEAETTKNVLNSCNAEGLLGKLEDLEKRLDTCMKSLDEFLAAKQREFPRFYFVSDADLLDILSNGEKPRKVVAHVTKVFLSTSGVTLTDENDPNTGRPSATLFKAGVGKEELEFHKPVPMVGKAEEYLKDLLQAQKDSLYESLIESKTRLVDNKQDRVEWLMQDNASRGKDAAGFGIPMDAAQIVLLVAAITFTIDIEDALDKGTMPDMKIEHGLNIRNLISLMTSKMSKGHKQRVMCMITMDTHGRDIIDKIIREKVDDKNMFQWQSQLRPVLRDAAIDPELSRDRGCCVTSILDASFDYGYEYLGNGFRLVVTPLTDRIYVVATQALNLKMGCAPAGPAGTGKTESTKDLASVLGVCIYVFNCAPEFTYKTLGGIFRGLAASGSWGCFDEFNRLISEVLSVCSVQFKAVCDGIRAQNRTVTIEGQTVYLDWKCGAFITMNPGYLGRQELPEGLKALFRPMTVMKPDLILICENFLMAQGFVTAEVLASKFFGLYSLLEDLLSKQLHYDWGLRAVKSVLVVAGAFKQADPDMDEQALLMRALRDFNTPKIVAEDEVIFHGLLQDLFPGFSPPRKIDEELEKSVMDACIQRGMDPDEEFRLKVVQLEELLDNRHCVFVMGPSMCGKSECWKTLAASRTIRGQKTTCVDINPKSIDPTELYGFVTMTGEWRDGLLSKTMRDLGTIPDELPKWIILDGDLDANWIESMNSVMDDNRMLTLASNERIPLKPHMRDVFEIRDLDYASPATVSRAGMLYISADKGAQWRSLYKSWCNTLEVGHVPVSDKIKALLVDMGDKYNEDTLFELKKSFEHLVPVEESTMITTLTRMMFGLLTEAVLKTLSKTDDVDVGVFIETRYVFCAIWAFGCTLAEKDGIDYRANFDAYWRGAWKTVKLPSRVSVFDVYLDPESNEFLPWSNLCPQIEFDSKTMTMEEVTVPTPETASVSYWMNELVRNMFPVMLLGSAGCGKTQLIHGILHDLDAAVRLSQVINNNFYTDSPALQSRMEQTLVKRTGTSYGPPGKAKLIYFIDDLNLPEVDPYNTQSAIALIRQVVEYGHVYDRMKLTGKSIMDVQFLSCMNPTAGSFEINPRLQRHFVTFAISFPGATSLLTIYETFLNGHLKNFNPELQEISKQIISGALDIQKGVSDNFKKSAVNFHYEFNIRHLSNVFQGVLVAQPSQFTEVSKFAQLWLHESERVYGDRLRDKEGLKKYYTIAHAVAKKRFPALAGTLSSFFADENPSPLIFCHYVNGIEDKVYNQVTDFNKLSTISVDALNEYNETNAAMNLVLFADAVKHVCRITRIILNPAGHALLVGVGGSGKQSLTRLAGFICGYNFFQIVISQTYGINELKEDLQKMYLRAGVKDEGVCFLFTESQITDERFLVYINDLLATARIPDLYDAEGEDEICNLVAKKVKEEGMLPEKDNCMEYFIRKVRKNLHVVLCFSPNGDAFRNRAMKFPALVNCTVIDWFRAWPREALQSVGCKYLADVELGDDATRAAVENFMPYSFVSVQQASVKFLALEQRQVHMTPKSFLELLNLYKEMLAKKREESTTAIDRLANGLRQLKETDHAVAKIGEELEVKLVAAEEKKATSAGIAEVVAREKAIVEDESAKAAVEEAKSNKIATDVSKSKADTEADLAKALPAVENAMAALATLNQKDISNAKTMSKVPEGSGIEETFAATATLLAGIEARLVLKKSGEVKDLSWGGCKKALLNDVPGYMRNLMAFKDLVDDGKVPDCNFKFVRKYIDLDYFNPERISRANPACGGLCNWVLNIVTYRDIVVTVEPKRIALAAATVTLNAAMATLKIIQDKVADLTAKLAKLTAEFDAANAEKQAAIDEVESGQMRLDLAQRLTKALAAENIRWAANVVTLEQDEKLLIGDVLLAAAFISYIGPFTKDFRDDLINNQWLPFLATSVSGGPLPMDESANPLTVLTNPAEIAKWNQHGLPSDRVSTENGSIVENTLRWPLLIDPQLQGVRWIQEKEKENNLVTVRLSQDDMLRKLEGALDNGFSFLIENMGERIDAILMPVIARQTVKRGRRSFVKLGATEVELHPKFRLIMHTKLSNPHYPPEIQAEAALINFAVTEAGLEDQLLADVVLHERPDLAKQRVALVTQQNSFKIKIKELEDDILFKLATAEGDITTDVALIEGLENTKKISTEIGIKSVIAAETEAQINITSEKYRSVANRGALVFFLMMSMPKIHTYYIYSLAAFKVVFLRGMDLTGEPADCLQPKTVSDAVGADEDADEKTSAEEGGDGAAGEGEGNEDADADADAVAEPDEPDAVYTPEEIDTAIVERCLGLRTITTSTVFEYMRRGLLEKHKLTIASLLCMRILVREGHLEQARLDNLVMATETETVERPENLAHWLPVSCWYRMKAIEVFKDTFGKLTNDVMDNSDDWEKWYDEAYPETVKCPGDFKDLDSFSRLQVLRALRPDRLQAALRSYVIEHQGENYVTQQPFNMKTAFAESSPSIPIFFVLFPGVDPTRDVEALGNTMDISTDNQKFINISMGQGQEEVALAAIDKFSAEGGWVMLQNLHLMQSFLPLLERKLEVVSDTAHEQFRCFISGEPPATASQRNMPESLMQTCIKIANESPADIKSNLRAAWANFSQETIDGSTKPRDFKGNLMTLCFYHSVICGRRRFGQQGWSRGYSFNVGDLMCCAKVLRDYLERYEETPWADLRYIFGQIMYGGHITDPWDRRCNETYLDVFVETGIYNGMEIAPGYKCPDPSMSYDEMARWVDDELPDETPVLFRLHPNAEINYLTGSTTSLFVSFMTLSGGGDGGGGGGDADATKKLAATVTAYLKRVPDNFVMVVINKRCEPHLSTEEGPYVIVLQQELGLMNVLLSYMRVSLEDLLKGLNGELNMTEAMEDLAEALTINQVPGRNPYHKTSWEGKAWSSQKTLGPWFTDMLLHVDQLAAWAAEVVRPVSLWLPGLFNPMAYLTAIMQVVARRNTYPLDEMTTETHVTMIRNSDSGTITEHPEDGGFCHGIFIEGARWGENGFLEDEESDSYDVTGVKCGGYIKDSFLKDLLPYMPVMYFKAVLVQPSWEASQVGYLRHDEATYDCPLYKTTFRTNRDYVVLTTLKTVDPAHKWTLAGVALMMQSD